jgi:hypothetical protein
VLQDLTGFQQVLKAKTQVKRGLFIMNLEWNRQGNKSLCKIGIE